MACCLHITTFAHCLCTAAYGINCIIIITAALHDGRPRLVLLQLQVCQPSWSALLLQQRIQQHWLRDAGTSLPYDRPQTVSVCLLNPLHACLHITQIPRNAIVVYLLSALRSGPNSTREPSFLAPCVFWSSPPSISGWGPAHGHSWDGRQWHSVDVLNPRPSSSLYLYY